MPPHRIQRIVFQTRELSGAVDRIARQMAADVKTNVSVPVPPVRMSAPAPPVMVSLPAPPVMVSLPEPPVSVSAPAPPVMVKASVWPLEVDGNVGGRGERPRRIRRPGCRRVDHHRAY